MKQETTMVCCICKESDATVHLTQIVGNRLRRVDLCVDCAKKKGVDDVSACSLADLLAALGASEESVQTPKGKPPHGRSLARTFLEPKRWREQYNRE